MLTLVASATPAAYNGPVTVKFESAHEVTREYVRRLSVSAVNKQASILTLTLTDAVPEKGKLILNRLVEVYNQEAVEDKNAVAANTIAFIDDRLQYLGTELTDVEKGVESFKQRNQVADMSSQVNQSLLDASEYNRQAAEYDIQLSALESISRYLTTPANLDQLIPSALSVSNPTLSEAITKFNELQLDRSRMLRTAQASNPVVENMTEQLKNLRANVLANISSTRLSVQAARRSLAAKSGQSGARIQQAPAVERGLQKINRQQELKRSLYLFLLQKREEAALSLAASVSSARVVDPAIVGEKPISPQKSAVAVLALLLGLGAPFAFVYLTGLLDNKVQLMSDVTQVMDVPILGELAHHDSKQSLVITKHERSALAEMFRMVRTNFLFATDGQPNQVVLITSSQEGEGKTFFSFNLGASLALANKKVVLVNLDLRKPHAHADRPGMTDYLLNDHLVMSDLVYPATEAEGLYRVSTGQLPSNPAELLLHPRMAAALAALRQQFDHIILDSSPIGQVSDAFALAPYLDYTIFLVRYNFTRKAQLNIVNQLLANQKMPPMALVLNDAKKEQPAGVWLWQRLRLRLRLRLPLG
ncbi:MAG: GNVR domain-containing protein [Hymenobacter sp.]